MNSLKELLYYRLNKDNEELILFIVSLPEVLNLPKLSHFLYFYNTLILISDQTTLQKCKTNSISAQKEDIP